MDVVSSAVVSNKHSRVVSVSGRTYRATPTMCDIFLAHVSDIIARGQVELVPLLHQEGVEMILVGEATKITVATIEAVPSIQPPAEIVSAA